MIAECNSYWQNITCTGRIWLILAEHDLYWQNLTSIGRVALPLAEYDFHWQNMIYTGWLSLLLVEYDFHWQNMIYTGLLSLLLAEYAANQKCSAVLLCSADSIYPLVCSMLCCQLMQGIAWSTCSAQQWQPSINQSTKLLVYGSWKAGLNHDIKGTVWRRSCCDITSVTDIHCAFSQ